MFETFGDRLKMLRLENDLTIDEFITAFNRRYPDINLKKSMVSKYENNIHKPKQFIIVEYLSEFFHVHINYISGRSDDRYGEDLKYKMVPILGTIAAGIPIAAQEDIIGHEYMRPSEKIDFCLKVKGNSMIGARIFDGDIVWIRRQDEVENGEIAAVLIDDEATIKRFYKENGRIILHAENPQIPDTIFTYKDKKDIKILGKVVYVKFEVI